MLPFMIHCDSWLSVKPKQNWGRGLAAAAPATARWPNSFLSRVIDLPVAFAAALAMQEAQDGSSVDANCVAVNALRESYLLQARLEIF